MLSSPSDCFLHLQFCFPPTINHTLQPHIQTTTSLRKHFHRLPIASTTGEAQMVYSWPSLLPYCLQEVSIPSTFPRGAKLLHQCHEPPPCPRPHPPLRWKNPSSTSPSRDLLPLHPSRLLNSPGSQKHILRPPNPGSDPYLPLSPPWIRVFLYLSPQLRLCDFWRQKQHTFSLPVVSGTVNGCCTEVIQEGVHC